VDHVTDEEADLNALWRTIYGEAEPGDEPDAFAIGHVILNRVAWRNWPGTIRGVCYQPWQFSCWNADNPRLAHLNEVEPGANPWAASCYRIARDLLAMGGPTGGPGDPTQGATHYYATYLPKPPKWARGHKPVYETPAGRYNHLFFNDIDTPAPTSAAEALEQQRPLSETRTVQAGKVAAGATTATIIADALQQVADVAGPMSEALEIAKWVFLAATIIGVGAMIYARVSDRKEGLR
jgi:hypothetical protein